MILLSTALLFSLFLPKSEASDPQNISLKMPGVVPNKADAYLCTSIELDQETRYIVEFKPDASMMTAHHMLLYACSEPGTREKVWACGEMASSGGQALATANPCGAGSQIMYAWAKDAPELKLPNDDVGFKIGGDSGIRYLVLQVHYMHPMNSKDHSGLDLVTTVKRMAKRAGTYLLGTGGMIAKRSKAHFETACVIEESVQMHPFAFRTHTHKLGKVVSGWKVQRKDGKDNWTLIGKRDPQLPQMFYPISDPQLVVSQGDTLAARCTMKNNGTTDVSVGPTGADEMCNFYMMYYVEGDQILSNNICFSAGPPSYHWEKEGHLNNIPEQEADTL